MKQNSNRLLYAVVAAFIAVTLASCNGIGASDTSYLFVKEESNSPWGMIDSQGKTIFKDEFSNCPHYIGKNLIAVREGAGGVIYTVSDKPKPINDTDNYEEVGYFFDSDLAPVVVKNQRISVIDTKGETKFTLDPINGKEITHCQGGFIEGLMAVMNEDGEIGAVDKTGSLVIKCKYKIISPFVNGNALAINQDDRYVLINKKGEEILKLKEGYSWDDFNEYGIIVKSEDDRFCFLTKKGEYEKLPASISKIYEYNDKYIVYRKKDGDEGVMTRDGEPLIRPKYSSISLIDGGKYFLVRQNDKYKLINKNDDVVTDFDDYEYVEIFNQNALLFLVKDASQYIIVDKNGKPIDKNEYRSAHISLSGIKNLSYIRSRYSNISGIISTLSDMINDNGIDGFVPGSLIKESMISSQKGSYSFYPKNHQDSIYGCSFSTYVEGFHYLYNSQYYYGYGYQQVFNNDNKIEFIRIDVSPTVASWSDIRPQLVTMLETKGFKKVGAHCSDGYLEFSGSKAFIIVSASGSNFYIKIQAPVIISSEEYECVAEPAGETCVEEGIVEEVAEVAW